jgi:hypothetical protein
MHVIFHRRPSGFSIARTRRNHRRYLGARPEILGPRPFRWRCFGFPVFNSSDRANHINPRPEILNNGGRLSLSLKAASGLPSGDSVQSLERRQHDRLDWFPGSTLFADRASAARPLPAPRFDIVADTSAGHARLRHDPVQGWASRMPDGACGRPFAFARVAIVAFNECDRWFSLETEPASAPPSSDSRQTTIRVAGAFLESFLTV